MRETPTWGSRTWSSNRSQLSVRFKMTLFNRKRISSMALLRRVSLGRTQTSSLISRACGIQSTTRSKKVFTTLWTGADSAKSMTALRSSSTMSTPTISTKVCSETATFWLCSRQWQRSKDPSNNAFTEIKWIKPAFTWLHSSSMVRSPQLSLTTMSPATDKASHSLVIPNLRSCGQFCLKRHGQRSMAPTRELRLVSHRLHVCICLERQLRVCGMAISKRLKTKQGSGKSFKDVTNANTRWWLPVMDKARNKLLKVSFQATHTHLLLLRNFKSKVNPFDCACFVILGAQMNGQVIGLTIHLCGLHNYVSSISVRQPTTAPSTFLLMTICSSMLGRVSQSIMIKTIRGSTRSECSSQIKKPFTSISRYLRTLTWTISR